MAIGFGVLMLAPGVFWALTPREFEAALRGRMGPRGVDAPLVKADLASLMRRFPD